MRLIRLIRNGTAAIVRDRKGKDMLVHRAKVTLRKMRHYLVKMLTGVLPDRTQIQIVLEKVRGILERLQELVRTVVPSTFGVRIRFKGSEFAVVWQR